MRGREIASLNEIRSIRASTSSAVKPASTVNGSIGVWRKRDFFFMRAQLNHTSKTIL